MQEGGVGVEADVAEVVKFKEDLLAGIEKYLVGAISSATNAMKAAVLDPNEANLDAYGVPAHVVEETWASLRQEVQESRALF
jgi:hypothetical protein